MPSSSDGTGAQDAAGAVERSRSWRIFARFGVASRALVYLVVGYLVLRLGLGAAGDPSADPQHPTSGQGAIRTLAALPGGRALLVACAIGLAAYALLSLLDAVRRQEPTDDSKALQGAARAVSAWTALVYALFCAWTVSLLLSPGGGRGSSGGSGGSHEVSATVMSWPGGAVIVGLVGAIVVITGFVLGWYGVTRRFTEDLDRSKAGTRWHVVVAAGVAGGIGRALAFVIVGSSVIAAAVGFNPQQAGGLDQSLRSLAADWYGPYLLLPVAVGMLCYGVYLVAEVHLRRV